MTKFLRCLFLSASGLEWLQKQCLEAIRCTGTITQILIFKSSETGTFTIRRSTIFHNILSRLDGYEKTLNCTYILKCSMTVYYFVGLMLEKLFPLFTSKWVHRLRLYGTTKPGTVKPGTTQPGTTKPEKKCDGAKKVPVSCPESFTDFLAPSFLNFHI
jgi:hypothetical protein